MTSTTVIAAKPAAASQTGLDRETVIRGARAAVAASGSSAPAPRRAGRRRTAATWTRVAKTMYDIEHGDVRYTGRKLETRVWALYRFEQDAAGDGDWADTGVTGTGIRDFWNNVTAYLKTITVPEHASTEAINAAIELGAAIIATEEPATELAVAADYCPTCGATGGERCHTSTGKPVKENGGRHATRTGDLIAPARDGE